MNKESEFPIKFFLSLCMLIMCWRVRETLCLVELHLIFITIDTKTTLHGRCGGFLGRSKMNQVQYSLYVGFNS